MKKQKHPSKAGYNRRDFIKTSALVSTAWMVPSFLQSFQAMAMKSEGHRKLVVIQLSGGNDGLNTIVPFNNDIYYSQRPKIAIPKSEVLQLNDELGMHPNLSAFKGLYDQGFVSIVNNVGYPNPNRSHFRAMDIWQSGSGSNEYWATGWLGRYLDANCQYPYEGLEVSDGLSLALKGEHLKGIAVNNPRRLYNTSRDPWFTELTKEMSPNDIPEGNAGYLYKTLVETQSSAAYILEQSKGYQSKTLYPKNPLANQLSTIAQFINSGLATKVYYANMTGFDTHANQTGQHTRLFNQYALSVEAFVKDLKAEGTFKDTLILTFSEFGRRVAQNGSSGTDHGTANNLFVIGENLKKAGVFNGGPDLTNLDSNGDIQYQVDFRSVYATILSQWMGVDDKAIMGKEFDHLGFV